MDYSQIAASDTIRILVATDSHVGYNERDHIRGDDSWKSFHEVMCLAKERDVDMVLLGGDLFHENKPSRKSMYQVMRSLRMNCLGEKPCELEVLSDMSENFQGAFNHVNYEDPDINVSIPVFSIHGNHDDPSGEGHFAALDLLQVSGLVNYFGRTPESDNIQIKPVLLQKGNTKLALYGMSNVRDERLFRTFRDGKVKFFQPSTQKQDWFNVMTVHQNHHAYTETSFLPENFLPSFLDLVVWGHEHECLINPKYNPEMNFHVMQPGSSVATSLMPGEAVAKHVAIVSVTGRDFKVEPIRLKTVRPFAMKEIVLSEEKDIKKIARKDDHRAELTRHLITVVDELIEQAKAEWIETQEDDDPEEDAPKPLIRLRVEYSAPGGGNYDCENPQRFSNRFIEKVANVNDVIQFYRKKTSGSRQTKGAADMPEDSVLAQLAIDSVRIEKLVREFLQAQNLTILPQNSFGDAVSQFVDKDDRHAMETFVQYSLKSQVKHLMDVDKVDEDDLMDMVDQYRSKQEQLFAAGELKRVRKAKIRPKPDGWNSDFDGSWEDQPGAILFSDNDAQEDEDEAASVVAAPRGRGKTAGTKKAAAPAKKAAPAKGGRGKKKVVEQSEEEEEDNNILMVDSDGEESQLFVQPAAPKGATQKAAARKASPIKRAPAPRGSGRATGSAAAKSQAKLNFSQASFPQPRSQANGTSKKMQAIHDDISDEDEAFEPAPSTATFFTVTAMSLSQTLETPSAGKYEQPTGLFINNEWVKGVDGKTFETINPTNEKPIVAVHEATEKDVDIAVSTARKAFEGEWRKVDAGTRGRYLTNLADLMEKHVDILAAIESLDNGKALGMAKVDVNMSAGCIRYYGGWADKIPGKVIETNSETFNYTRQEPIGVCGQIIPWNFPLLMWTWKIGPAIACGNVVVLKSAEQTPLSALYVCNLVKEAGFPPGVINVISGFGKIAGAALSAHMDVDKIAFTGSTVVGRQVMKAAAGSNLKKVTLELGGKSPNIVFKDADIDNAISWVNFGIFFNHGQCCCAGSRIYVQEDIYDKFVEKFKERAEKNVVGDPFDEKTFQGPQVSQLQYDRIMGYIDAGKKEGAKVETGGERHGKEGYFVKPTIFSNVSEDMKIMQEEIFGPVCSIAKFKTEEDAIRVGNATTYGLAAAVHTSNLNTAIRVSNALKAGTVWVNQYNMLHHMLPFGGYKESGIGRELGEAALANYSQTKTVSIRLGDALFG
ncbi:MAG: hypothetical protein Q9210_002608 [Variospora velana]